METAPSSPVPLSEDEFRVLACVRAYADRREQKLNPTWVQEQLALTGKQLRVAARRLAERGLAEFVEWSPEDRSFLPPGYPEGPIPVDLRLTEAGWRYLWPERET